MAVVKAGRDRQGANFRCARKSTCGQIVARLDEKEYVRFVQNGGNPGYCMKCHAWCNVQEIYGRFVSEVVCGSKCTGAVGPSCDCSCGGVNHGGGR